MTSIRVALAAFIALIIWDAGRALAYDVELSSDTEFRAYQVRSPTSTVFWARRRLVDTVGLRYIQNLSEANGRNPGPFVRAQLTLRLLEDFGETCFVADEICLEATDPQQSGVFQPLARDGYLEAPLGYIEVDELPAGVGVRAGRQLTWDRIGFARFDGVELSATPWPLLRLQAYGGSFVTNYNVGGSDAFVPEGLPRIRNNHQSGVSVSWIARPLDSWVLGAGVEIGSIELLRVGISFRQLWEGDRVSQQRGGVGLLSRPAEPLYLQADAVWDLFDLEIIDAQVSAELEHGAATWRLSGQRHVPRYDPATIWAYFDVAPIWEEKAGASWRVTPSFEVGGAVCGRHTEIDSGYDHYDHDAGVEGNTSLRWGLLKLALSGFTWAGTLGPLWGFNLDGSRPITPWFVAEGRVSLWQIANVIRSELRGASLSETLGATVRVTDNTKLSAELSHAFSERVGNRFWFYALLHLGAWR